MSSKTTTFFLPFTSNNNDFWKFWQFRTTNCMKVQNRKKVILVDDFLSSPFSPKRKTKMLANQIGVKFYFTNLTKLIFLFLPFPSLSSSVHSIDCPKNLCNYCWKWCRQQPDQLKRVHSTHTSIQQTLPATFQPIHFLTTPAVSKLLSNSNNEPTV